MQDTFETRIPPLTFSALPDHTLLIRNPNGLLPVGIFSARMKINESLLQTHYFLDDAGQPHGSLPFEKIMLSFQDQYACIKGATFPLSSEKNCAIQGFITALVPAPKGNGNQYVTIFLNQNPNKKSRIYFCCGMDGEAMSIYSALTAIAFTSHGEMAAPEQRGWQ